MSTRGLSEKTTAAEGILPNHALAEATISPALTIEPFSGLREVAPVKRNTDAEM
ncbi:MAG: hypothetical protein HRF40_01940 [Nitrososphaera sp.]